MEPRFWLIKVIKGWWSNVSPLDQEKEEEKERATRQRVDEQCMLLQLQILGMDVVHGDRILDLL